MGRGIGRHHRRYLQTIEPFWGEDPPELEELLDPLRTR
jgi:hypothetical protein